MEKILYKEVQKFRQPWVWLIIIPIVAGTVIYFSIGINQQVIGGKAFGDKPMSDAGLIIVAVFSFLLVVGLSVLFYTMKMITEVRSSGICFRYPPMLNKNKMIRKEEIESYEVRTYKAIKEYGGYGIKVGLKKYGKAYTVRGNSGLQLLLKNGDKVLLGTQRREAIRSAVHKMMSD